MGKKKFWFWVVVFFVNVLAMAFAWMYPVKLAIFFVVEMALMWWGDKRKNDLVWAGILFVMGPVIDVVTIYGGAWKYGAGFILGVPIWLPFAYGVCGLLIRRLVEGWLNK